MSVAALPVMRFGPMIRGYEDAVKDKSYRRAPIGQEAARYLRSLRWSEHSELTVDSYEGTYARLALDHDDYDGLADFCTPVGTEYLREFLHRHWGDAAPATKHQRTSALRSLFAWMLEEGLIPWNPAAALKLPRRSGGGERIAYPVAVLYQLVTKQPHLRDQCALQLLCRMGLRKNELRLLKVGDVDLARNLLLVHGKGNRDVVLPLGPRSLRDDLYLHFQEESRHPAEYLIYPRSRRREKMDPASVHRWLKRCLERAGLPATVKTHELRHSSADLLWRHSKDIVMAKELLRHSSVKTTETYLHPTRADLAVALEAMESVWKGEG